MVTRTATRPIEKTNTLTAGCTHHWVIEPAQGPLSGGVCKKCGAHKEFHNSLSDLWPSEEESAKKTAILDDEEPEAKSEGVDEEEEVMAGAARNKAPAKKRKER